MPAETEDGARYHARKFTPRTEDAVTGWAAVAATLYVSAKLRGNTVTNVKVGGYAVKAWNGAM